MLEMTRLRVFQTVARLRSFTAAATELGFSQPAISHQIAQLEREVGGRLFARDSRRLALTPAGEILLAHVDAILLRVRDAERELAEAATVGVRRLRVAAFATAASTFVPIAVGAFRRENPAVELTLVEGDPPQTLPQLAAGTHDLVLAYDYPVVSRPAAPAGVEFEPLFVDQMVLALPLGHALVSRAAVELADLHTETWCAPHDSVCRDALDQVCRDAGFAPRVVAESNDYLALQGLVASGAGVAVMPRLAIAVTRRPDVVLKPLVGHVLERVTSTVTRTGAFRSPAVMTMEALLITAAAQVADPDYPLEAFEPQWRAGADSRVLLTPAGAREVPARATE